MKISKSPFVLAIMTLIITPMFAFVNVVTFILGSMIILESIDPNPMWTRVVTALVMLLVSLLTFILPIKSLKLSLQARKLDDPATNSKISLAVVFSSLSLLLVVVIQIWFIISW
jgi:uncharacterized membrane protein YhaH (DUF805 family)